MPVMPAPIPRRVREMTPEWLTEVFAEAGIEAPSITALDVEQINIGTGFAGRVLRLRPTYEGSADGAPASLIAKTPSPVAEMRAMLAEMRGYELESLFYAELLEGTPTPVPTCLWNAVDIESGDFMLILEDLDGYDVGGQTGDDVDPELVTAMVVEAARLHRAWWNDDRLLSDARIPGASDPGPLTWQRRALEAFPVWEAGIGSAHSTQLRSGIRSAIERFGELGNEAARDATTLVHGDYRLDNAMHSDAEGDRPLVILDWQLLHRGSGAYDIGYLLGQSAPTDLRREHEDRWLGLYLDELGQPGYDEVRLRRDVAIGLLRSMAIPLGGAGMNATMRLQVEGMPAGPVRDQFETAVSAGEELMRVISDRGVAAIEDHDALRVLA